MLWLWLKLKACESSQRARELSAAKVLFLLVPTHAPLHPAGAIPGDESALDLLPAAGLVTSSEDYYPTVAINALMRVLRDPGLGVLHSKAVASLFDIVKAMRLNFVPYLPKVRWGQGQMGGV